MRRALSTSSGTSLGFIGLGNMGGHMAANLARLSPNATVHVYDINSAAMASLVEQGGGNLLAAESPEAVARSCATVITMLPSSPHVSAVYADMRPSMRAGQQFIDSSTIEPAVAQSVAQSVEETGATLIDAPVSGGVGGAQQATLTFMVGGPEEAFLAAKPVLEKMGRALVHCGAAGSGQTAKIVNNLILAISMMGVSEGMNLGVKLGMDPKVLAAVINTSTGRCWSSDTYNPCPGVMDGVPSSRGYTGGFGSALMRKDLGLAVASANANNVPMPLTGIALATYNGLVANGQGHKDFSVVYEMLKGTQ